MEFLMEFACKNFEFEKIKKLISNGYDINRRCINYSTPIEIVSEFGYIDIVKWLYKNGADPTIDNNWPIRIASGNGHLSVVKYLYKCGADPCAFNNQAIKYASRNGHFEVVKYLVLIGCDINLIYDNEMKIKIEQLLDWKPVFNKCLIEIYGHPRLERTRTENENYFCEFQTNLSIKRIN